jgi:hypothetical protein
MTKTDELIAQEVPRLLEPGEQVLHTAILVEAWRITAAYVAVVTNGWRLILIRTRAGLFGVTPTNDGVEVIPLVTVRQCKVGGIAARSLTFVMRDGSSRTLRSARWSRGGAAEKAFFEHLPQMINGRQKGTS